MVRKLRATRAISPGNNIPVWRTRIFARLKTARPYIPMALTLFPTEICLKFASVPGPEAHKYVIPPISRGSVAPLPIFSRRFSLPPLSRRRRRHRRRFW